MCRAVGHIRDGTCHPDAVSDKMAGCVIANLTCTTFLKPKMQPTLPKGLTTTQRLEPDTHLALQMPTTTVAKPITGKGFWSQEFINRRIFSRLEGRKPWAAEFCGGEIWMAKKPSISGRKNKSIKPERARKLIRRFHVLLKAKAAADAADNRQQGAALAAEMERLGGLETYQLASISGQSTARGGDSSKVLVDWLPATFRGSLLEVGCLHVDNACARSNRFTHHVRIDLNSQHPQIREQDFMTMPHERFNVISLSLVVNYVPDVPARGQMLARAHEFLEPEGLLFFVLPRACVDNSRYCSTDLVDAVMDSIGFAKQREHKTAKLVYWLYKKTKGSGKRVPKTKVRDAATMNNFAITL